MKDLPFNGEAIFQCRGGTLSPWLILQEFSFLLDRKGFVEKDVSRSKYVLSVKISRYIDRQI